MNIMLHEKSNKKSRLNSFGRVFFVLLMLLFVGNVHAQNEITLSLTGNNWGWSITPSTLTGGGFVDVTFDDYACADRGLAIQVDGVAYMVEPYGNTQFETSNGQIVTTLSGGLGTLDFGIPGEFCDWERHGFTFRIYLDFAGDKVLFSAESSFPPKIFLNQSQLNPFKTCPDRVSGIQTFIVSGRDLTDNIEVKPLDGYEYSTDNIDFFPSLSIEQVEGRVQQTVYVRLAEGNEDGTTPAGNIECATSGAESKFVAVSGTVEEIEGIRLSETSLTGFLYREGSAPSEAKSFEVSACSADQITVNAPANFEISIEGETSGFGNSVTLSSVGGTVWVRMNAASRGFYTGNVSVTDGVVSENMPVSGTVEMYDCVNHPYQLVLQSGRITGTICALDECDAIFEIKVQTLGEGQYYADFGIKKVGSSDDDLIRLDRENSTISSNGVSIRNEGYKVQFQNAGLHDFTLYADMRNPKNIIISSTLPVLEEAIVVIKGETTIRKCDPLSLAAYVCPLPDFAPAYRWYRNNVLIDGENDAALSIDKVMEEAIYTVEVLDASGNVFGSSRVTVLFDIIVDLPAPEITSTAGSFIKLNDLEHQINQGYNFSFNITLPETAVYDYYVLQGRSLDVDSFWVDLQIVEVQGSDISVEVAAQEGMLYRLKAFDEGECSEEHFSEEVLVRVILNECRGDEQLVYYDNFGFFRDENVYAQKVKEENEYIDHTDIFNNNPIEKYWAPDPDGSVVNHTYAMYDTQNYAFCDENAPHKSTGGFFRVEDGYFSILPTPGNGFGDCGEDVYWGDIQDHTLYVPDGYPEDIKADIEDELSTNKGAMLFINVADLTNLPIYERRIPVKCNGVNVTFSAFINNAVKAEGSDFPVNVRLDIFKVNDIGEETIVKSVSSGDIRRRIAANMTEDQNFGWARLMCQFTAEEGDYLFRLVNNAPSGAGNDLLFDDISITLCTPSVNLVVDGSETTEVVSCSLTEEFILRAKPVYQGEDGELIPVNLEDYIPTPHFAFRKTSFNVDGNIVEQGVLLPFEDGSFISVTDSVKMLLTVKGRTEVEMIVASSAEIVQEVINGTLTETDKCAKFFLRDTIEINFHPYEPDPIDTVICPEEIVPFPDPFLDDIKWYYLSKLGSSAKEIEGSFTDEVEPGVTEDQIDKETQKEISAILLNRLKTEYQEYFENPANVPWDGVSREFYLAFGTFSGCYYDGSSKEGGTHNDSLAINLTVLPRIVKSNISATADGNPLPDLVQICSDASKDIKVSGKIDGTASDGYNWVWILKETGEVLLEGDAVGSYTLTKSGSIPNEGTLIVTTDLKCTDSLEIPFKFYEPFTVELEVSSNIIDNELCLSSESGEEVTLTAVLDPANRDPEPTYYWYEWNGSAFVEMPGNPAAENTKKVSITEKGKYQYRVVAVDNICFTSHNATAGGNVDDNSFDAYYPVKIENIVSSSLRNDTVCVGDELTFTATITNPRAGIEYVWTSTHEGSPETGSFSTTEETTEITFTIGNVQGNGQVELSIKDALCGDVIEDKKYYTFILVKDKEIQIQQADPVCLEVGQKTGETIISLEAPTEGAIRYEWYNSTDELIGTGTATSQTVSLKSGENTFYVKAIGECDELRSENMTVRANEHFEVDFKVSLSGDEIDNGGYLCLEGNKEGEAVAKEVTLTATLLTPDDGSERTYYWYKWQNGTAPVKINETTSNTNTSSITDNITDNGNYKYMVEVADGGICYSPVGSAIDVENNSNADTSIFKARKPLSVDFQLSDLYCEDGRKETIKATVKGHTDPNDLKDIIYTWKVNGTEVQSTASAEYALTIKEGDKIMVSINDIICGKNRSSQERTVEARKPLELLDLRADLSVDTCALDSPKVCFSLNPSVAQEWKYYWEVLNEKDEVIKENETNSKQNCITMPLGRSGIVRVFAFDELCEAFSDSAKMSYDIRDSISIDLKVKDLDGNIISDGLICRDSVILEAAVIKGGTTGGYTWTWFDGEKEISKEPVELDKPAQRKIELTPEWLKYTVIAAKEDACDHQDAVKLGTNLIPTTINIIGDRGSAFCSTEDPLELTVTVDDERITDLSNIHFEWKLIRENGETVNLGNETSATYPMPSYDRFMPETIQVTATYKDRGDSICTDLNTRELDISVRRPLQISTPDNNAEYNICLDEPYREVTLTVNVLDGRPDSIYWYKNGVFDMVDAVNGFDVITRIVQISDTEVYTAMVKDEVCGEARGDSEIEVSVTHKPKLELVIDPDVIEITQNTQLTAVITPHAEANSPYIWSNDIGWNNSTPENTTTSDYIAQEGTYTFSVTTTVGHCSLNADAELEVLELINNIITPYNKNGMNDVFMGPKDRRPGYKVEIFNRYQQKIFEGDNGWDGTYRGVLAEPGTYFYRIIMESGRIMRGTVEVAKF